MSSEIIQAIEQVGREKGIEVDVIIRAVEDAYAAASKKYYRTKEEIGARFNRQSGVSRSVRQEEGSGDRPQS